MITYTAEMYEGTKTGKEGFHFKTGVQIVATDADTGQRRYVFSRTEQGRTYKTPCLKTWEAHYKSWLNASDREAMKEALAKAETLAENYNVQQPF